MLKIIYSFKTWSWQAQLKILIELIIEKSSLEKES